MQSSHFLPEVLDVRVVGDNFIGLPEALVAVCLSGQDGPNFRFAHVASCFSAFNLSSLVGIHDKDPIHEVGKAAFDQQRHHDKAIRFIDIAKLFPDFITDTRVQDSLEFSALARFFEDEFP